MCKGGNMEEKKKSSTEELLESGKILQAWPFKDGAYALSITPAVDIDKVKFAFFKKGQNGAGFDVYVSAIVFWDLLDTLKRYEFRLGNKWEYRTGENGSKQVTIENGEKALLVIHGFGGDKEKNATVGINRDQAAEMLILWNLFFKDKFQQKWEMSFKKGQQKDFRPKVSAVTRPTPEPEAAIPADDGSKLVLVTLCDDIEEKSGFKVVTVTDGETAKKLWIKDGSGYDPVPWSKLKAVVEEKGDNLRFIKTA